MVSSGTVNGDLSSLNSCFSSYTSSFDGLSSSWQGPSFEGLHSKAESFVSEFSSTIQTQMESFASACDMYTEYKATKDAIKNAEYNYNSAVQSNNDALAGQYSSEISTLNTELSNKKSQILGLLNTASGTKLEATSITASASSVSSSGGLPKTGNTNWADDANFTYYNQSGGWNNYRYSGNGSNTMGASGCGPCSMAMVMSSFGLDVDPNVAADWSADHGYHPEGGTEEGFFTAYANELGVNNRVLGRSKEKIAEALQNNELVILHVGPGQYHDFTDRGHFIVARAYDPETNKVLIADPNRTGNNRWHDLDRVVSQLKGTEYSWAYST